MVFDKFDLAASFLFSNTPVLEDEYDQPIVVCVEHKRFIPCRPCMYVEPAKVPYSCNPLDVELIRIHHNGP